MIEMGTVMSAVQQALTILAKNHEYVPAYPVLKGRLEKHATTLSYSAPELANRRWNELITMLDLHITDENTDTGWFRELDNALDALFHETTNNNEIEP